ncbi:MAG: S-layer homology domain-containing protein [Patescibacteria group bacterium]
MVIGGLSFAATQTEWLKGSFLTPSGLDVVGIGNKEIELDWHDSITTVELGRWRTITTNQMTAEDVIFTVGSDSLSTEHLVNNYFQNLEIRVLSMEGPAVLPYPLSIDVGLNPEFDAVWSLVGTPIPSKEDDFEAAGLNGSEAYAYFSGPVAVPEGINAGAPIIFQDGDYGGIVLGSPALAEPIYCGSLVINSPVEGENQISDTFETTVSVTAINTDGSPYTGQLYYTSTDENATFSGKMAPFSSTETSFDYIGTESATIEISGPGDTDPDQNCLEHVNFTLSEPTKDPLSTDFLSVKEINTTDAEIEWDSGKTYVLGKWEVISTINSELEGAATNIGSVRQSLSNQGNGFPVNYFSDLEFTVNTTGKPAVTYDYPYIADHVLSANVKTTWTLRGTPMSDKETAFESASFEGKEVYGYFAAVDPSGALEQDEKGDWGGVALNTADEETQVVVDEEPVPDEEVPVVVETPEEEVEPEIVTIYVYDEDTDTDEGLDEDTVEILTSDDYICSDPFADTYSLEESLEELICRNYESNIVDGRDPDHYKPSDYITRAEFLKIVLRSAGYTTIDADGLSESFADVGADDWFLPYVVIGYSEGYIFGDGSNFRPDDPITRADAVVIGMRVAGVALDDEDNPFGDIDGDEYYADAVITAGNTTVDVPDEGEQAIVGGYEDGDFHPLDFISRGDAAALVNRMAIAFFLEEIAESLE